MLTNAKSETGTANFQIADKLEEMADILERQDANSFRVNAYRRAGEKLRSLESPVEEIFRKEGHAGLVALPAIGERIASAIGEMITTGRWSALDRVTGTLEPSQLFQSIPGIGPKLAEQIHDTLHIDTLEALEIAAHDGSLQRVSGIGPRHAASIRAILADRLGSRRIRTSRPANGPPIKILIDVDSEYRVKAQAGTLATIAPLRFNPSGKSWLPVLHTHRGDWEFTALYSNTARAHALGKTDDWVLIYFQDTNGNESMYTVVTETRGALQGRRVVRGREKDCEAHYADTQHNIVDRAMS